VWDSEPEVALIVTE
jgi:hypothetical protein